MKCECQQQMRQRTPTPDQYGQSLFSAPTNLYIVILYSLSFSLSLSKTLAAFLQTDSRHESKSNEYWTCNDEMLQWRNRPKDQEESEEEYL